MRFTGPRRSRTRGYEHLVAVKRILPHLAEDEELLPMIVDEAEIASLLHHPNIARVYEFARAGGEYFGAETQIIAPGGSRGSTSRRRS
jgi:serine/threonine protein kinase